MVPVLNVALLKGKPTEDNRKKSLDAVARWKKADEDYKRVCKDLGIKPVDLVC